MLTHLTIGDVHFDYLANGMFVRFLQCKVIIFSFAINKCFMERYFETMQKFVSSLYCKLLDLAAIDNCLK